MVYFLPAWGQPYLASAIVASELLGALHRGALPAEKNGTKLSITFIHWLASLLVLVLIMVNVLRY